MSAVIPLVVIGVGSIMIATKRQTGVVIVCQLAWLVALGLICITLVAWQVSFIPMFHLR